MSKYTTELRYICEHLADETESKGYTSVNEIISKSRAKIFNFSYPIFDPLYKPVLETKILKHYYGREIGAETFGRWQLWLDAKMNEIMPYYNKLYESELLEFNPLHDIDLTITKNKEGTSNTDYEGNTDTTNDLTRTDNLTRTDDFTRTDDLERNLETTRTDNLTQTDDYTRTDNTTKRTQDSGTESDQESKANKNVHWDLYSDTPQGSIQNIDVQNNEYLTNARKITDDGTGTTASKTTTFGKLVTETNSGTVNNAGTSKNTGTQGVVEEETNTGTQKNGGTSKNTGTQSNNEVGNSATTSSTDVETTEDYLETIKGKHFGKSYSELLLEYRKTLLNIDMLVINELSGLFFGLW